MQKRLECQVSGRVQLVMFRDFTKREARSLGIKGTVKNNPDGTVSVIAEGDEVVLHAFLKLIGKGPILARVDGVKGDWKEPLGEYKNFDILYE
ncbi:MAG: acylphosphatase [bacterium]|nr:acylphosphatase [bacterium]